MHVGFFGDSYLHNTLLPVQYSFTEPLHYLLNDGRQDRFTVLNFGVEGYGTAQSYLHYLNFEERQHLDYVFYLFCFNDIEDISNTDLFRLDRGRLINVAASQVNSLLRWLAKLHVTYLVLDVSKSLSITWAEFARNVKGDLLSRYRQDAALDFSDSDQDEGLRIFAAVLRRWKTAVEAAGGEFYVVLLPMDAEARNHLHNEVFLRARRVVEQDLGAETVDLLACAREINPSFRYQDIRFRNDAHWNEAGNMLAAKCLYRFIERSREIPRAAEAELTDRLRTYYSAFLDGGWQMPPAGETRDVQSPVGAEVFTAIRREYLELDLRAADALARAAEEARKGGRVVRANWEIHVLRDALLYIKADCQAKDTAATFFLQWVPVENARLPFVHLDQEFVSADFSFATYGRVVDGDCLAHVPLPPFSVAWARTGQFEEIGQDEYRNIWQAHVPLVNDEDGTQAVRTATAPPD